MSQRGLEMEPVRSESADGSQGCWRKFFKLLQAQILLPLERVPVLRGLQEQVRGLLWRWLVQDGVCSAVHHMEILSPKGSS